MLKSTAVIIKDIKDIKVQGASNILFAAQNILETELLEYKESKSKKSNDAEYEKYFTDLIIELWRTRPTEPALKNFLTAFLFELRYNNCRDKNKLLEFVRNQREIHKSAIDKIAENFVKTLKQQAVIFTHCHSSIVEKCIIEAHKKGFVKYVVNTETRPLFQGRITSQRLAEAGVPVRHIVDSAAYAKAKNIIEQDKFKNIIFLTGADVITHKGDLVNKIGTCQLSLALGSLGVKHYVMTISAKIDIVDRGWVLDKVEMRSPKEVWNNEKKNKNIKVLNYAFDITPSRQISKIFTENGDGLITSFVLRKKIDPRFRELWQELDNKSEKY